jgi:hypothetical protein
LFSNTYAPLSCPNGYYVSKVEGNTWDDRVGQISSITCTNYMDPSKTARVQGSVGAGSTAPIQSFDCGARGVTGVLYSSDLTLDSLHPICAQDKNGMAFNRDNSLMGANKDWPHIGVPNAKVYPQWCQLPGKNAGVDAYVTEVTGANSTHKPGRVTNFNYTCKDFTDIAAVKKDPRRKAAVCIGTDPLTNELKGALDCPSFMSDEYCVGDKAFNDQTCKNYFNNIAKNASPQDANKWAYCQQGANFQEQQCLDFCNADGVGSDDAKGPYKDQCDAHYKTVCQNNNSPVCSCLSKPSIGAWTGDSQFQTVNEAIKSTPGASQYPQCYFQACNQSGYKLFSNKSAKVNCPTCLNSLMVTNSGGKQTVGGVVESCSTSDKGEAADKAVKGAGTAGTGVGSLVQKVMKVTHLPNPTSVYVVLVALIAICIIVSSIGGKSSPAYKGGVEKFLDLGFLD